MSVTNYYAAEGQLLGEQASGQSRRDYLADALGSVVGTATLSAAAENSYRYKPYGALLSRSGAASDPAFQWVGSLGYRQTGRRYSDVYVRARHYGSAAGQWTTKDPLCKRRILTLRVPISARTLQRLRFLRDACSRHAYQYSGSRPLDTVDPAGLVHYVHKECSTSNICEGDDDGDTYCNTRTGCMWSILCNENSCTKECTDRHEKTHRDDFGPCCGLIPKCRQKNKLRSGECADSEQNWETANHDWGECRAFLVEQACLIGKLNQPSCMLSDCYQPIVDRLAIVTNNVNAYCAAYGNPPGPMRGHCPIGDDGSFP